MSISACPARDWMVSMGTPWACSWLTKVCRQECGVSGLTPGTDFIAAANLSRKCVGYRHITDSAGALSAAYEYRALDLFHRLADMYARAVRLNVPGLQRKQLLRAHTREEQQPYAVARLVVRQVLEQLSDFFRCEGVLFAFPGRVPRLVSELDRVLEDEVVRLGLAHDLKHHAPALGCLRLVRTVLRKIAQEGLDVCGAYAPQRLRAEGLVEGLERVAVALIGRG